MHAYGRWVTAGALWIGALVSSGCELDAGTMGDGGLSGGATGGTFTSTGHSGPTSTGGAPDPTTGTNPATTAGPVASDGGTTGGDSSVTGVVEYERRPCELISSFVGDGPTGTLSLQVEVVVSGLEIPWGLAWLPNGDMLVTERTGKLRRISKGQLQATPVIEVDVAEISIWEELGDLGSEGGLSGVLLHPEFESNRSLYMYWTARKQDGSLINRLGVFTMSDDYESAHLEKLLLDNIPGGLHHQGGRMRIGPYDGKLYVGVGAYDPELAQNPNELPGKLLRMDLDGSVPDDNPTRGSRVFASGIRNTQGYDWFDAHHMLVMDHGPTSIDPGVPEKGWDEFNVVRAGENLGWPDVLGCSSGAGVTQPAMVWERSPPPAGAAIYTGTAIPQWESSFLFATLGLPLFPDEGQHLHRIQLSPNNPYVVEQHDVYLKGAYGRLRTVAMGPDGHVYLTTSNCDARGSSSRCAQGGDKVLRIVGAN